MKKDPKLIQNKAIIYIGINDIRQKEFDITIWRQKFQELITILKSHNDLGKLIICNVAPCINSDNDSQFWKRLEELNGALHFLARDNDKCQLFRVFNIFAARNDLSSEIPHWRYVSSVKILYTPRLIYYRKITPKGEPDFVHWSEEGYSTFEYKIKKYLNILPVNTTPIIKDNSPSEKIEILKRDKTSRIDKTLGINKDPRNETFKSGVKY